MVKIVATAEASKLKPNVSETIRKEKCLIKSFNVDRELKNKTNIRKAIIKVCKGKKKHIRGRISHKWKYAQYILEHLDDYVEKTYDIIIETEKKERALRERRDDRYDYPNAYTPKISGNFQFRCKSGKIRSVTATLMFPDQIIHQLIVMVAEKPFTNGFYFHSYGSITNKGPHKGAKAIRRYIRRNSKNIKHVCQLDVTLCFQSINHQKLLNKLRKKFRGHLFYYLCYLVIDCYTYKHSGKSQKHKYGLPIGFVTSHWFCNFYLTDLDHYIKQELKVPFYIRYVDDMIMFSSSKKLLHKVLKSIRYYFLKLDLTIKPNWQVYRFIYNTNKPDKCNGRAIDVLGYRFFRDKVILRKRKSLELRRTAKYLSKIHTISPKLARSFISQIGSLRHCNSKKFYLRYIKPHVDIRKIKRIISYEDRKQYKAVFG